MSSYINAAYQHGIDVYEGIKNPPYAKLDGLLSTGESYFNKLGYIPGLSIMTGKFRESFGWFQMITGVSSCILRNMAANLQQDSEAKEKLYKQAEVELSYAMNGLGNVVRGMIEQFPLWDLHAVFINKVVLALYDLLQVRMNYGYEASSHGNQPYKHPILRSFVKPKELEDGDLDFCKQGKWIPPQDSEGSVSDSEGSTSPLINEMYCK